MKQNLNDSFWVYQSVSGEFFKSSEGGGYPLATKVTTKHAVNATRFTVPLDCTPHFSPALIGGKWVKVHLSTSASIDSEDCVDVAPDYKQLLTKYLKHVADCEGTYFASSYHSGDGEILSGADMTHLKALIETIE